MRRTSLFALGAVGGALCDGMHIRGGALSYRRPTFAGQPWWVAPQFGVATVAIVEGARRFPRRTPEPSPRRLAFGAVSFVGAYAATARFHRGRNVLTAALAATAAAQLARRADRGTAASWAVLLAVAGTTYESALSGTGAFSYAAPDFARVPVWLPALYVVGAPLALDVAATL